MSTESRTAGHFPRRHSVRTAYGHNGGVFGHVFTTRDGSRQVALAENYYDLGAWQAQESLIGALLCR
jgi:hypothetical protein